MKLTSNEIFKGDLKMKQLIVTSLIVTIVLGLGVALAYETTGNGAPKAKLLGKLNIIGVKKDKNANMEDNDNGSVIFVGLGKNGDPDRCNIYLTEGDDFAVLDKNGTDGEAAFMLPDPNLEPYLIGDVNGADTESAYTVVVRALGKPGGLADIRTCADLLDPNFAGLLPNNLSKSIENDIDDLTGAYCSVEQVPQTFTTRYKGKSEFMNVTAELLTIVFAIEIEVSTGVFETVYVRVPIFDDIIENEYWAYDNQGLKLLQVRFYDVPTDVQYADEPYL
jgi:hypothetical protein